ncbi:MAG TPA: pilus assembly protein PilP, partial [Nitrospirales bacterium]|nr:pilus assembly protein PilP [Nitrospirales bacterium]
MGPAALPGFPLATVPTPGEYSYNPSGRREPFLAIVRKSAGEEDASNLPPLQRTSLSELGLIGIVWGGFGFTAMVQAPDGRGYSVRPGTRIGPNNGIVSSITENAVVVQERFTDVYG